jgi:TPR repeat protein
MAAEQGFAAQRGHVAAAFDLGEMYAMGEGAPKDPAHAARSYRMAARQGNAAAQYALGFMCAVGDGVPKDPAQAVRLYRAAAEWLRGRAVRPRWMHAQGGGCEESSAGSVVVSHGRRAGVLQRRSTPSA